MKIDYKKILAYSWPFIGLLFFIVWGWIYIKPMLPDDFFSFENIGDKIANVFKKEEGPIDPDNKYDFIYTHTDLKPKTEEELGLKENPVSEINENDATITIKANNTKELEEALNNAKSGDGILLGEGVFMVNLELNKDITIIGQGFDTVLTEKNSEKAVININNSKASLSNLLIKDSRVGLEANKGNVSIENVKFEGLFASACYVNESEFKLNNSFIYNSGVGVKAINSSGEISKSIIKSNKRTGIELRGSKFSILANIIANNGSYGVFADQTSEVVIEGNFIDNNEGFEVRIEGEKKIYR